MEENGLYPESDDTFDQITLSAYKLGTAIKVSEELMNDSVFDLESYISTEFARRIGAAEEEAFLVGDGRRSRKASLPRSQRPRERLRRLPIPR
jgi:HK97 family phage major capsid protein